MISKAILKYLEERANVYYAKAKEFGFSSFLVNIDDFEDPRLRKLYIESIILVEESNFLYSKYIHPYYDFSFESMIDEVEHFIGSTSNLESYTDHLHYDLKNKFENEDEFIRNKAIKVAKFIEEQTTYSFFERYEQHLDAIKQNEIAREEFFKSFPTIDTDTQDPFGICADF